MLDREIGSARRCSRCRAIPSWRTCEIRRCATRDRAPPRFPWRTCPRREAAGSRAAAASARASGSTVSLVILRKTSAARSGVMNVRPCSAARTASTSSAAAECLSTKPAAPSSSARRAYAASRCIVRNTSRTSGSSRLSCARASRPFRCGMEMSATITSGRSSRAAFTRARPSSTMPASSNSPSSSPFRPSATMR